MHYTPEFEIGKRKSPPYKRKRMKKRVHVVHCVDTEGPLNESLEATFERLKEVFGLALTPTETILAQLQNKEIPLEGREEAIAELLHPNRLFYLKNNKELEGMLIQLADLSLRGKYRDSLSTPWRCNWFCVDHVGYTGENPRARDLGHHKIYDRYRDYVEKYATNDFVQWHYHPLAPKADVHRSGTKYLNSSNIFEILSRKIIDKLFFPTAFRPGFHTERPDSHWFLEMWIPFDYGNQSLLDAENPNNQPDICESRYGDWRGAPTNWTPYHPDFYDYRKEGSCNRWIARCLNMEARHSPLTTTEIENAFREAREKGKSLLAFANHDYRNMIGEIQKTWKMIHEVSKKFNDVEFIFSNAVEAMQEVLSLNSLTSPGIEVNWSDLPNGKKLIIQTQSPIFGPQPFLAIKTKKQEYVWENFDFDRPNQWSYTFDFNTFDLDELESIGVAASTKGGVTEVLKINVKNNTVEKKTWNQQ